MATFQYIALDGAGQEKRGTIEAGDRASAIAAIRAHGLFPSAIGEVKSAPAPAAKAPKGAKAPKAAAPKKPSRCPQCVSRSGEKESAPVPGDRRGTGAGTGPQSDHGGFT